MRILIVSNMNASQPYGAWTRPYYLGEALSQSEQVFQLGFDTSEISYGQSRSVYTKNILVYIRAIRSISAEFKPHVIYCHETFPAMATYLATNHADKSLGEYPALVFDVHSLHAAEYKAMLTSYDNRLRGLYLFAKAYYSQRFIARRSIPLVAASDELKAMLIDWYGVDKERIDVVSNGAPSRYLTAPSSPVNPYPHGLHFALLVAPKNMLPNELAVEYTLRVAERLQALPNTDDIRIAVAGGGWQSEQIEKFPNLVYLGFAKDILAYIDHADVCVLPYPREAVCGGARNKALDYFAREKIVLSTLEGMRGLTDFKPGEHVFHSSYEPEKFTNDLIEIFCNPEKFRHLGKNARRLVEVDYNWQRSAEKVMTVFRKVI